MGRSARRLDLHLLDDFRDEESAKLESRASKIVEKMTSHRSLLERLEHVDAARKPYPGVSELRDAVREHLQRMLNTRQGGSVTVPDFGTPDFSGFFRGYDSIQFFREEVTRTIQKYEPRLANVQVAVDPGEGEPFRMRFDIHAEIRDDDQQGPVVFSTVVECSGEVKVR